MKLWFKLLLAALVLTPLLRAAEDELAGEKEAITRPVAKPTMAEPDQGGPIALSRNAKGAGQPSFELPEFVIKGGGEKKAVSRRPDLSTWMDTSGGIKASPSEAEASKTQVGAQSGRQTLSAVTESARPAYGQAKILYGLANTLEADAFYGQELEKFYYLLRGSHGSSDGGPAGIPTSSINQSRHDLLAGHGGWRLDDGAQLGLGLGGRWRDRLMTRVPLPAPRAERSLYDAGLSWDGRPDSFLRHRVQLKASRALALLPGLGSVYEEGSVDLSADLEAELLTRKSRTVLLGHLYGGQLDQGRGDRIAWLAGGWLMARIDAWKGARLSLGLSLDSVSGGMESLLLAPRVEFEQRLGLGMGVWAKFGPRLEVSTLSGRLFDLDAAFPGARARPSKDSMNLEAGLSAALPRQVALEIKGALVQNEDGLFLDDAAGLGLWQETNVRASRRVGAELNEKAPLSADFSETLSLKWQNTELLDSLGLMATFSPAIIAEGWLQWRHEIYSAALGAIYTAEREGRLAGGDKLPACTDLRIKGGYEYNDRLTVIAELRNLMSSCVQEFSGYADPAPMVGAGVEFKF